VRGVHPGNDKQCGPDLLVSYGRATVLANHNSRILLLSRGILTKPDDMYDSTCLA
jgi:hypothetical protein